MRCSVLPPQSNFIRKATVCLLSFIPICAESEAVGMVIIMKSSIRNEIKAQIIRAGYTMQEVVDQLHDEYGWSDSVSNLSGKLQRESLRYREAVELADVLGYDIVWQKRRD